MGVAGVVLMDGSVVVEFAMMSSVKRWKGCVCDWRAVQSVYQWVLLLANEEYDDETSCRESTNVSAGGFRCSYSQDRRTRASAILEKIPINL